jgi:hypothetical protein
MQSTRLGLDGADQEEEDLQRVLDSLKRTLIQSPDDLELIKLHFRASAFHGMGLKHVRVASMLDATNALQQLMEARRLSGRHNFGDKRGAGAGQTSRSSVVTSSEVAGAASAEQLADGPNQDGREGTVDLDDDDVWLERMLRTWSCFTFDLAALFARKYFFKVRTVRP